MAQDYVVMQWFNGTRFYVSSTRPLNGGWVGTNSTDRKGRAKRYRMADAKRLAAQLNQQDSVGWHAWEAVPATRTSVRTSLEVV